MQGPREVPSSPGPAPGRGGAPQVSLQIAAGRTHLPGVNQEAREVWEAYLVPPSAAPGGPE